MYLSHYIQLAHETHLQLCDAWTKLAQGHSDELDLRVLAQKFADASGARAEQLAAFTRTDIEVSEPTQEFSTGKFRGTRTGNIGLLRDLHEVYLMNSECDLVWTLLQVGAQGTRHAELLQLSESGLRETKLQLDWLRSRLKQAAPQALVVAE